jgi:hypothetical protein
MSWGKFTGKKFKRYFRVYSVCDEVKFVLFDDVGCV